MQDKSMIEASLTPAAVLVPIFNKRGGWHSVVTKRSQSVQQHKGEISFAGGIWEQGDSDLKATAYREAQEEIGIDPKHLHFISQLPDVFTLSSGYKISPFLAKLSYPYSFTINHEEIEQLLEIPIFSLTASSYKFNDKVSPAYNYQEDKHNYVIWGATAHIISHLQQYLQKGGSV